MADDAIARELSRSKPSVICKLSELRNKNPETGTDGGAPRKKRTRARTEDRPNQMFKDKFIDQMY
jgi:hypothetical protein